MLEDDIAKREEINMKDRLKVDKIWPENYESKKVLRV